MAQSAKKSTSLYWLLFIISLIVVVAVYFFAGNYITVTFPFILYFFVKALNII